MENSFNPEHPTINNQPASPAGRQQIKNIMANKTVKKSAKKSNLTKNIDRVQSTVKSVNKEVLKTAGEVVDDILENGKELKTIATKTVKEAGKKINFGDSVEMIRKTTNSVNAQVWKTTEEVLDDIAESGKELVDVAAKTAKEAIENINLTEKLNTVKKTAKNVNEFTLETAEEIVDGVFSNGEKWQDIAAKALKGSLQLAGKQQEIVFDTMEAVKGQLTESAARIKKLFKSN